jgi:DNA-binding transcriptional LysR family regulator
VNLTRLGGEKFVSFEPDAPTRKIIDRFLREHRVEIRTVMEFDNIETVKRAVEVENGVSIVPANTVREEVKGNLLKVVRLAERLSRPLGVIYQRNRAQTPAQAEFIAALRATN